MFDPNEDRKRCEEYLSRSLNAHVEYVQSTLLTKSSREAPWRLDVKVNGVERSFVLQLDIRFMEREYRVLKAMEATAIPTPKAYGLDLGGDALGTACFFSEYIEGESLLSPMLAGEAWAEDLYIDTVLQLQAIEMADLRSVSVELNRETATDFLENAYSYLKSVSLPLADTAYNVLRESMPLLPAVCFSNGDLWLDNFIVKDGKLAAVIDFQGAGFSDPIYEFLLSFFVAPELQGRGIEERYCRRIGSDPEILLWYRGLEFFDTWHWVLKTGEGFVHHTAQSLEADLKNWLDEINS